MSSPELKKKSKQSPLEHIHSFFQASSIHKHTSRFAYQTETARNEL